MTAEPVPVVRPRRIGRPPDRFPIRRREILDAAIEVIADQGYHATSIADICSAAGVGRGVLYHYFKSKEEILLAIFDDFTGPLLARFQAAAEEPDPELRLRALSREILHGIVDNLSANRIVDQEWQLLSGTLPGWEQVRERQILFEEIVRDAIADGQAQGKFRNLDLHVIALAFWGAHNYAVRWFNPKGRLTAEQITSVFATVLLNGVTADGS
jgi:AcrR family transcriptional regulator